MIFVGIDEAGRGPVIGPMVIAMAVLSPKKQEFLIKKGVVDSKLLTQKKIFELEKLIKKNVLQYETISIPAKEIDALMQKFSLNEIEAVKIGKLISKLKIEPDTIIVDSPDINPQNFVLRIKKYCSVPCKLLSQHKADLNYTACATASILAKSKREKELKALKKEYGDFGSGYPGDPKTKKFLMDFLKKNRFLPEIVRKTWTTSKNAVNSLHQKKLFEYHSFKY